MLSLTDTHPSVSQSALHSRQSSQHHLKNADNNSVVMVVLPVSEVKPSNFPFLLLCKHTDHSMHKQQTESTPPPPTATTFITYEMQSQQVPIGIVNKINIILSSYALLPTYATWIHLESRKNYSSTRPQCLHDLSTTRSHRNKPQYSTQSVAFYNPTTLYNPSSLAQIFYYDDYSRGHRPHHHNNIHTTFTHIYRLNSHIVLIPQSTFISHSALLELHSTHHSPSSLPASRLPNAMDVLYIQSTTSVQGSIQKPINHLQYCFFHVIVLLLTSRVCFPQPSFALRPTQRITITTIPS